MERLFPAGTVDPDVGPAVVLEIPNREVEHLQLVGVGIFGTFTGYLANLFLAPSGKPAAPQPPDAAHDQQLNVGQLKALMAQQQTALDEINLLLQADQS